jgi:hypothetical protein
MTKKHKVSPPVLVGVILGITAFLGVVCAIGFI